MNKTVAFVSVCAIVIVLIVCGTILALSGQWQFAAFCFFVALFVDARSFRSQ